MLQKRRTFYFPHLCFRCLAACKEVLRPSFWTGSLSQTFCQIMHYPTIAALALALSLTVSPAFTYKIPTNVQAFYDKHKVSETNSTHAFPNSGKLTILPVWRLQQTPLCRLHRRPILHRQQILLRRRPQRHLPQRQRRPIR